MARLEIQIQFQLAIAIGAHCQQCSLIGISYSFIKLAFFYYKLCIAHYFDVSIQRIFNHGGGAVDKSVRPSSGRLSVRIPAATDVSRNKSQWATPLIWERFLHVYNKKFLLSPFVERHGSLFEKKIWISSTQGCFMPRLDETGPVVLK